MSRIRDLLLFALVLLVSAQIWQTYQLRLEIKQLAAHRVQQSPSAEGHSLTMKDAQVLLAKASKYAANGNFRAAQAAASQACRRIEAATNDAGSKGFLGSDGIKDFIQDKVQKVYQPAKEGKK